MNRPSPSPPPGPGFALFFEQHFMKSYAGLASIERRAVDRCLQRLRVNPRYPGLNTHKAHGVAAKYAMGGDEVFIAYASRELRVTFEYGPEPGMIAVRNCGHHDPCERRM